VSISDKAYADNRLSHSKPTSSYLVFLELICPAPFARREAPLNLSVSDVAQIPIFSQFLRSLVDRRPTCQASERYVG
jgi:hypothetical protein